MPTFFESSFIVENGDLIMNIQGRVLSAAEHDRRLLMMCGNAINAAFFELMELPLWRSIQLFETWYQIRQEINEAEKKAAKKR